LDDKENYTQIQLTRLEYIDPNQSDVKYQISLLLHKNQELYYPELILEKATQNGTYKQVHFTLDQGFKDWKFDLSYDIYINDFDAGSFKVALINNKKSFYLGEGISQNIETGNYTQNITGIQNKMGDSNTSGSIPVMAYGLNYQINGQKESFVFKNSVENPRSVKKDVAMNYTAVSNPATYYARTYKNEVGYKQYELTNHLGNVLSVVSDKKLVNIDRGIVVLQSQFSQAQNSQDIAPFVPTAHLEYYAVKKPVLYIQNKNDYQEQGITAPVVLQSNHDYLLQFEVPKYDTEGYVMVKVANNTGDTYLKELIKEKGKYYYKFKTGDVSGIQTLSFKFFEKAKGLFALKNISLTDITDADFEQVLENNQNMAIFVPSVLSFNDYYPFGMLMPGRHANTDRYRYGFNGKEKDDEIKGIGNSVDFGARMYDTRLASWCEEKIWIQ